MDENGLEMPPNISLSLLRRSVSTEIHEVRAHVVVTALLRLQLSFSLHLYIHYLPRCPSRGRFYPVWITCPSWHWVCWWKENLFPLVEP